MRLTNNPCQRLRKGCSVECLHFGVTLYFARTMPALFTHYSRILGETLWRIPASN
jgi:hypothetical protein